MLVKGSKLAREMQTPREVLELLSELEYHWSKAKDLIPRIYEVGTSKGMTAKVIRRMINERIDLSSRQIRNLTPQIYKDSEKANKTSRARREQTDLSYAEILEKIETATRKRNTPRMKVREVINILRESGLVQ